MNRDPRPREEDVENYMRELEALGFSDRVARSRDEAMVWRWQDEIRDQPTHEQLLNLLARVREDERRRTVKAASEALDVLDRWGEDTYRHVVIDYDEAVTAIESLGVEDD